MVAQKITGIYKIVNTINGHKYVGSAVDIESRWYRHKWNLNRNEHHSQKLQNSWNKNGADCFEFIVIEECAPTKEVLEELEQYWIDTLGAYGDTGYNMSQIVNRPMLGRVGKDSSSYGKRGMLSPLYGRKHSVESRALMSAATSGEKHPFFGLKGPDNPNYGKKRTEEQRLKMSGKNNPWYGKFGPEHPTFGKKYTSEELLARSGENSSMYGKHHSEKAKEKIGLAQLGEKNWMYGRCGELHPMYGIRGENHPNYGRRLTEEQRAAVSGENASMFGRKGADHPKYGKKESEETRKKKSESHKGLKMSKEAIENRIASRKMHREERLIQLPVVLAKLLFTIYSL